MTKLNKIFCNTKKKTLSLHLMRRYLYLCCMIFIAMMQSMAQDWGKMSPFVRSAIISNTPATTARKSAPARDQMLCAFVKCTDIGALSDCGCPILAQWGDICIANIPRNKIAQLAADKRVLRIEAQHTGNACTDTTATLLKTKDVWEQTDTQALPLTGKGVVMGIQDIGFDLTHPTFYNRDLTEYRVKAFWDMLDEDNQLFVGRDYHGESEIIAKAHSRDGLKQTHGTHTAGIAAGSGYNSPYRGMAPEADLCLVSNYVSDNSEFVSTSERYKFTSATDVMGFKYIFDYAQSQGKPCVISFSEGASEDLEGDTQLMEEVYERMTGPGKILVASAGNRSVYKTYLCKPRNVEEKSSFIYGPSGPAYLTLRASTHSTFSLSFSQPSSPCNFIYKRTYNTRDIILQKDSTLTDTLQVAEKKYAVFLATYPSCYNQKEWATELYIQSLNDRQTGNGADHRILLTLEGADANMEAIGSGGFFLNIDGAEQYQTAVPTHNINYPACLPSVIAVGANSHRQHVINHLGIVKDNNVEGNGVVWQYSSVGPTLSGLMKPDVVAPGCNIISSYSSFYEENNPGKSDITWDVEHFDFNGRTYAWNSNSGTSMSAPVAGGIIALWLQLCPTLAPADIMDIIANTSKRNQMGISYPNNEYGWGEIDALAGINYIREKYLDANSIQDIDYTSAKPSAIYDLQGIMHKNIGKNGIFIVKYADGSIRKIKGH